MADLSSGHSILLVNDDVDLLDSTQARLNDVGYTVTTAKGGDVAIGLLAQNVFEVVLLDIQMSNGHGLQVMDYINDHHLKTVVIVLSPDTDFHSVSSAYQKGAFDFLRQPCDHDTLLATLKKAFEKQESDRSLLDLRKQLELSERLHRFMIDSSPDIIFIVDKNGHFAFANDRAEDLLNYRKDELIGEHFSTIVDPEFLEPASHCFNERRAGPRATRDAEIWLMCKPASQSGWDRNRIAIEMNSLGVYENELQDDKGNIIRGDYSGTYVVAWDITERLASEKLIHYQAYHDLLTGLPNRALFHDRLSNTISSARRQDDKLAVLFLDLDRFKVVNDTVGHSVGDSLLKQVADRLKSCLREGDTVARLGGDEFIVLLPNMECEDVAHVVGSKLVNCIKKPFIVDGKELFITASIGISIYPEDGTTADLLIKHSDTAMYYNKKQGKNSYNLYDSNMTVTHSHMLNLEADIRRGLNESQFELYYQPQVSSENSRICGVEALLRWNHPEKGLLTPMYFLSIAEEAGTIIDLGDWVLETAVAEVKRWLDDGLDIPKLAINCSSKQIEKPDFVRKIINTLKKYNFPGSRLEIEITESMLMNNLEQTVDKLSELHKFGVNVAIDDFGTGYSSLSVLQKLPIHSLKIDRSFIHVLNEQADKSIIEAIANMAKGLKLEMVAEGVEDHFQLAFLRSISCPVVQGFIYSKAVSSEEARSILEKGKAGCISRKSFSEDEEVISHQADSFKIN